MKVLVYTIKAIVEVYADGCDDIRHVLDTIADYGEYTIENVEVREE